MKRVLITGANSYIGKSVEAWLSKYPDDYVVETIDMIGETWKTYDFSGYDCVYHVAGIAHSDSGDIPPEKVKLYRTVNTELAIACAEKAKTEGVKQFIFMSSAIVYGNSAPLGKRKLITKETAPAPANCYSDSKWQAELGLQKIAGDGFRVCVLRPPMIYGKGSKGNYPVMAKLALKMPLFPKVNNERSMLYIENLCEFVRLMIENEEEGVFWPQNGEYSNTTEMVREIAAAHGRKLHVTALFNWGLYFLRPFTGLVDKAFGSLAYEQSMSEYKQDYQLISLKESIKKTEM